MATPGFEWVGYAAFDAGLAAAANFDPMPLLDNWAAVIVEGNRRGVLGGRDGFDNPMPALQYRNGKGKRTANRKVPDYGRVYTSTPSNADYIPKGPYASGHDLNLTSSQYKLLTGPRLAPRRDESRVITQLYTEIRQVDDHTWEVVGAWGDVVSAKGVPFLMYHFTGAGHNPRYDLRPVRPRDLQFCRNFLDAYAKQHFFASF